MTYDLKYIVRLYVEDQFLRKQLREDYDNTSVQKRDQMLNFLHSRGLIDQEVKKIIDDFYRELSNKYRNRELMYFILSLGAGAVAAHFVNKENWIAVVVVLVLAYFIYSHFSKIRETW